MITMNESLIQLVEEGFITMEEAYSRSVDKQDMNDRVNNWLLAQVEAGGMTPLDAVKQSYFRPNMIERLRTHGYGKGLRDVDLSTLDLPEEVVM
jgi:hypothetical protein